MDISDDFPRCSWAVSNPLMRQYHDSEWGVPVRDDNRLFEFICLEGAQAGLSWQSILNRRQRYREVFHEFDIEALASGAPDMDILMQDSGIIRNRAKILSVYGNARSARHLQKTHGSLSAYLWEFVDGAPVINRPSCDAEVPAVTTTSTQMSKDLRSLGFNFVGPTICYALMQAVGMVDDHLSTCFRCSSPTD